MCLSGIIERNPEVTEGIGWKCFEKEYGYLTTEYVHSEIKYQKNKWYKASEVSSAKMIDVDNSSNGKFRYPAGFHIFKTRQDARDWGENVRKVQYRKAHTIGYQAGTVIVSEEMMILG